MKCSDSITEAPWGVLAGIEEGAAGGVCREIVLQDLGHANKEGSYNLWRKCNFTGLESNVKEHLTFM